MVLAITAGPRPTNAGFFSAMIDAFTGTPVQKSELAVTVVSKNSQNMALLQSTQNPDPLVSVGGGDITIVGGSALLSDSGPLGSAADIKDLPASDQISIYTVHKGDTISAIAKMFGVSVNTIRWANDLGNKPITEGQVLVILPITGVRHTVKKGDNIEQIAKKYRSNADEIAEYNGLAIGEKLTVGDEIIIPDGDIDVPAPQTSSGSKNPYRGGSGPSYAGYYQRPITGGVKTQGIHGYNGIDLASSVGTPIYASAAGTVIVSRSGGWNGGYGNYIVISHPNGTQTLYSHLNENFVAVGERVTQGQQIGTMGNTGKSTGPHLHFEIRGAKNPF